MIIFKKLKQESPNNFKYGQVKLLNKNKYLKNIV